MPRNFPMLIPYAAGVLSLAISPLTATAAKDIFAKYPNRYFIESGSYLGDGIQMALNAGFPSIYSIEISDELYARCVERFERIPNVHAICGDSSEVMKSVLENIHEPATFWLDGHYSSGNTEMGDLHCPLLRELDAIASHPIKTHTILIDDIRYFGEVEFDYIELEQVQAALLKINPSYKFSYEDGHIPNDILVAKVAGTE
ncbi:MAG: hypothetical protein JSS61_03800 [Verrucomicrobia bacterium]|nr:hypothetical protein [Verrucomicrobiota bacterium]